MTDETPDDPTQEAQARIRAAADQLGAAMADAFHVGLRVAVAKALAEQYGPGPWILHEDGRVERMPGPKLRQR